MTKEVWIVMGAVTDPDAHNGKAALGDIEWQFSDGPSGQRGSSADFISLMDGLRAHRGCKFHVEGPSIAELRAERTRLEDSGRLTEAAEVSALIWATLHGYVPEFLISTESEAA